jgi:hypothetical protein
LAEAFCLGGGNGSIVVIHRALCRKDALEHLHLLLDLDLVQGTEVWLGALIAWATDVVDPEGMSVPESVKIYVLAATTWRERLALKISQK